MKKLFAILAIFAFCGAYAQQIPGFWYGQLNAGGQKLRIVFNISASDSGYRATMDSPDQGMKGFLVDSTILSGDTLRLKIVKLGASYKGVVDGQGSIKGVFRQSGLDFALDLSREPVKLNRPQTPKPPYPYVCEDVTFTNVDHSVTLAGTLTMPSLESKKFACVVLVSGSGPQNRDEELLGHKPFAVIADHLTRNGIAVLRYDDRGVGKSTGKFSAATTADFTSDALSAVDFLMSRPEIDKRQIGILGHSEGGTIVFMAAAQNPKIGYVISLAGATQRGDSLLIDQNRDIMVASDYTAKTVDNYVAVLRDIFRLQEAHSAQYITDNQAAVLAQLSAKLEKLPSDLSKNAVAVLNSRSAWLDYFKNLDPAPYIAKTKCHVMAINGSRDVQVNAVTNLAAIAANLKNGKVNFIKQYDGLNHLFQQCTTGLMNEYSVIEQTIAPEVLENITTFILTLSNSNK